ncbi:HisG, C-terminal domain-containing protein [Lactifluus volemus]|nr:HisG, C-terminal domain-containing protein [Lactifluus volemus]
MDSFVTEILQLGFGKCALQVQLRSSRRPVFCHVDARVGLASSTEDDNKRTSIEYLGGSVEAACALGLADGIVDLVESGETMRAAGLRPIATLLPRIAGVIAARQYVVCQYNVRRQSLSAATAITPGRRAPTIAPLEDPEWRAVSSMVERSKVADVMDQLVSVGAEDIMIFNLDNSRV